jgi:hypothetical protein
MILYPGPRKREYDILVIFSRGETVTAHLERFIMICISKTEYEAHEPQLRVC